jgi:hypothetical protein
MIIEEIEMKQTKNFTDFLPWKIQSILGYRPNGVIGENDFFNSKALKILKYHETPKIKKINLPVYVEESIFPSFLDVSIGGIQKYCSDFFVANIGKGQALDIDNVITIIKDNKVVLPLSYDPRKRDVPIAQTIYQYPEIKKLKGKCLVLSTTGARDNYYNWSVVMAQKIGFLKKFGYNLEEMDYILINKPIHNFQNQLIDIYEIPRSKIIETDTNTFYDCEQLIALPHLRDQYYGFEFVKAHMLSKVSNNFLATKKHRIYCSRKKNKLGRRIENEEKLEVFLKKYDFETVIFEDMSVLKQAELMKNTEIIIAPHGAGFVNTIYADKGTKVIELFNKNSMNIVYWLYAMYNELIYGYLMCDTVDELESIKTEHFKNISVDLNKLKQLFDEMDIKPLNQ